MALLYIGCCLVWGSLVFASSYLPMSESYPLSLYGGDYYTYASYFVSDYETEVNSYFRISSIIL